MLGQMSETFSMAESSTRMEGDFFSVAITIPLVAIRWTVRWRCKSKQGARKGEPDGKEKEVEVSFASFQR